MAPKSPFQKNDTSNIVYLSVKKISPLLLIVFLSFISCTVEELTPADKLNATSGLLATDNARVSALLSNCGCTYVVPPLIKSNVIDGHQLGLKPGSKICLNAATKYGNILFRNIKGTADKPITIENCGGQVVINAVGMSYTLKTEDCEYFRISGGNASGTYGIKLSGGNIGITLDHLSTEFEVDHIEIASVGFAGIMAKTDPTCDNATIRGKFTMRNISLHDNYVHNTGAEGFYVGNSSYANGVNTPCGRRYPHSIDGVKIYNNTVKYTGWDGIQLGSATLHAQVYSNTVVNYGTTNIGSQNSGIQIGEGTGGLCYSNFVKDGSGNGMTVLGLGDNLIHDNVIVRAGNMGIFCDERYTPGPGFKFINNTIINPHADGIRLYAELVPMNVVMNNIIVDPGTYDTYQHDNTYRNGNDSYVYLLFRSVKVQKANNYFTRDVKNLKFSNPAAYAYELTSKSPAINKGINIAHYNIHSDFFKQPRLKGTAYDIGASEY